ncbi:gamma-glutamylcyclotransferase [Actinopolymorpha singaporensis]
MTLYAAYASNLSPREMAVRCPHSPLRGTGWMTGWRLTFGGEDHGWEGALPTVVEDPVSEVFVALYDLAPADEARLDDWEGASLGLYRKVRVWVQTLDGGVSATSYVLDAFEGGLPSARYLGILADAADLAGAPSDYTAALRRRPCRSIGQ